MAMTKPTGYQELSRSGVKQVGQHEEAFHTVGVFLSSTAYTAWATDWRGKKYVDGTTDPAAPDDAIANYICSGVMVDPTTHKGRTFVRATWTRLFAAA